MKWTLAILSFLVLFSGSAIAELTPKDLEAIRNIVDDRITESEKRTDLKLYHFCLKFSVFFVEFFRKRGKLFCI